MHLVKKAQLIEYLQKYTVQIMGRNYSTLLRPSDPTSKTVSTLTTTDKLEQI